MAMMPRDDTDSSAAPSPRYTARKLDDIRICAAADQADDSSDPDDRDSLDYDALYCEVRREKGRYELVCDSIKADLTEQLTARSRRICAARYRCAVDRLLCEVEDAIDTDTFGGAA